MEVTSWQEDELRTLDSDGAKITRASIGYRMTGDADGESTDDVLMCYRPDGTATVVGLWQVTGSAAGRQGRAVFESNGGYDGATARSEVRVVPGSGTGGFAGLHGSGAISATGEQINYVLNLEF